MELKDYVTLTASGVAVLIAVIGLGVNIFWNRKAAERQQDQLRLANRIEYQKLLFETDKMLVQNPHLSLLFDHGDRRLESADPTERLKQLAQLQGYASYHITLYEVVYVFFVSHGGMFTKEEHEVYEAWNGWFVELVRTSPLIRELLLRDDAELIYNATFMTRANKVLQDEPASKEAALARSIRLQAN